MAKKMSKKVLGREARIVNGQLMMVTICVPGKVRKGLGMTKSRYTKGGVAGANYVGTDRGTKVPFIATEEVES